MGDRGGYGVVTRKDLVNPMPKWCALTHMPIRIHRNGTQSDSAQHVMHVSSLDPFTERKEIKVCY